MKILLITTRLIGYPTQMAVINDLIILFRFAQANSAQKIFFIC